MNDLDVASANDTVLELLKLRRSSNEAVNFMENILLLAKLNQ